MCTRMTLAWTTLALAATVLVGCGDSTPTVATPANGALSKFQLGAALLTADSLGPGFADDPPDKKSDDSDLGCLTSLDSFAATVHAASDVDAGLAATPMPWVAQGLASFRSPAEAHAVFGRFRAILSRCHRVDATKGGVRITFDMRTSRAHTGPGVDEQVNVASRGSAYAKGRRFPLTLDLTIGRTGNNIDAVLFLDFRTDAGPTAQRVFRLSLDRLNAIVRGRPVPRRSLHIQATRPG
jgi:hypothetical protein